MARYRRRFVNVDVPAIHRAFLEAAQRADTRGDRRTAALIRAAHANYNRKLRALSIRAAASADKEIKRRLEQTARRSDTGVRPHLRDAIHSRPIGPVGVLESGIVGVADMDKLDRVTAKDGTPYWIVQELGTTRNIGRQLKGYFYDKGFTNAARPAPGYTGTKAAQPLFRPGLTSRGEGTGPRGGTGGKGIIRNPIPARHFVGSRTNPGGADRALALWRTEHRKLERETVRELRAIITGASTRARRSQPRRRGPGRLR